MILLIGLDWRCPLRRRRLSRGHRLLMPMSKTCGVEFVIYEGIEPAYERRRKILETAVGQPCAPGEVSSHFAQEPADRHPRQITRLLSSLPLLDRPNEVIERIADEVLGHIGHPDTVLAEDPPVVTGLVVVEPAEPFDVIYDDRTEEAIPFLGVGNHRLKRFARSGLSAADRVIGVPAKDVQAMFLSVLLDRRALIVEGLFLLVS